MYDPILVPVDGSEASERATAEAFRLAREAEATVHLVYVLDESASTLLFSSESMGARFDRLREEAAGFLDDLGADAGEVPIETAVVRGMGVYRGIVDYAEDQGMELIVMGTRGRHGPAGILGSTSERVASHTEIPVLLVSPPPGDEAGDDEE